MTTERAVRRRVAAADSRAAAGRLYARIVRSGVSIAAVASATPHDLGGTYGDSNSRSTYVRQVLSGDRTSAPMVAKLESAFASLKAARLTAAAEATP